MKAMEQLQQIKTIDRTEAALYLLQNWEKILRPWQQLLVLYVNLFFLAGVGGAIFYFCEYSTEDKLLQKRAEHLERLGEVFGVGTPKYQAAIDWGENSHEFYYPTEEEPDGINKWELRYAGFFAVTTFTTIGYGLQAPVTLPGKAMVFLYGLPAIFCYAIIAKLVGEIVISFFASFFACFRNEEIYNRHKITIISTIFSICFFGLAYMIYYTSSDDGFGNGIYTYFDALYFLVQTTLTIGYGDVMMSGGSSLTIFIAIWLTATMGITICLLTEIGNTAQQLQEAVVIRGSKLSRLSSTLIKIKTFQSAKKQSSDLSQIEEEPSNNESSSISKEVAEDPSKKYSLPEKNGAACPPCVKQPSKL